MVDAAGAAVAGRGDAGVVGVEAEVGVGAGGVGDVVAAVMAADEEEEDANRA